LPASGCASTVPLSVSGELDIARAPQPDDALGCALADAALLMLDLGELEFMHSSGVHLIEVGNGRARQADWSSCATPSKWSGSSRLSALTANPSPVDHPPAPPPASVPDRG
jgi:hypothetical protein